MRETIKIVYINRFEYKEEKIKKLMKNEPIPGNLYRAFYMDGVTSDEDSLLEFDSHYRLLIENSDVQIANIVLKDLKGDNDEWTWDVTLVDENNIVGLDLDSAQYKKLSKWKESKHNDLDKRRLRPETGENNELREVNTSKSPDGNTDLEDIYNMLNGALEGTSVTVSSDSEEFDSLDSLESIEDIYMNDPLMAINIQGLIEYISVTYSDKYNDPNAIFDTKAMLFHDDYGKEVGLFNVFKYLQRYMSKGYSKSDQLQDLLKAIHYLMFELIRKTNQELD